MMSKLEATVTLTRLIAPKNIHPLEIKESLLTYSKEDWEQIIYIANADLLAPLLYKSLLEKNLFELIKDEELTGYLKEFYLLNETRNLAILKQLGEICSILKTINVKPTLLKGSAALSEDHYKSIGERVMLDIDFYVDDERVYECINILKEHGYKEIDPQSPLGDNWHHYRRMYREDVATSIEVHRLLLKEKSLHYFPDNRENKLFQQSSKIENAYILKPMYELYYAFLHTEISHFYHEHKHLSLRHMQHFNVIMQKYKNEIDLEYLNTTTQKFKIDHIWNDYLSVQNYFYDLETPAKQSEYLNAVKKRINVKNRKALELFALFKMIKDGLGYTNLRKHYKFKSKFLMIIFVPLHLLRRLFSYSLSSKKRDELFENADHFAS